MTDGPRLLHSTYRACEYAANVSSHGLPQTYNLSMTGRPRLFATHGTQFKASGRLGIVSDS